MKAQVTTAKFRVPNKTSRSAHFRQSIGTVAGSAQDRLIIGDEAFLMSEVTQHSLVDDTNENRLQFTPNIPIKKYDIPGNRVNLSFLI